MVEIKEIGKTGVDGTYEIEEVADDPFVARFLSPDPFIQSPGNAQNYNRYSYALNNPLKYTDPSGYMFRGNHQPINPGGYVNHGFRIPLGRIAPGSGNNWSDAYGPMRDDFTFMSEKSVNAKYGIKDEYDDADTDNNTSGDVEFTLTGVDAKAFFEEVIDGMSIYMISAFGQNTLVSSFGDFGSINISEDGGIGFTNFSVVGAHLFTLEVGSSGGGGDNNIIGGINTLVGAYGAYYGLKGNATHNELYWRGKNGNFYSTSKLSKPGGYARSYKVVNNTLKSAKTWSNRMAVVGLVTTGVNIAVNQEVHASDGINAFMCGISFTGVGSIVAGAYFVTDLGFEVFTGNSLNERIDLYIEGPGGSW